MKSLKKILAILLVMMMLAATFASCGRTTDEDNDEDNTSITEKDKDKDEDESPTPTPEATPETTPEATPEATPEESTGSETVTADEALGVIEGSTYVNDYFGFSMAIPEDWYKASREDLSKLMNFTADFMEENSGKSVDLAMQQILPLLMAAPKNPFEGAGNNPNILCLGQNIKDYKALITDAPSFMNLSLQGIKAQGIESDFGDVETLNIDGVEFAKVSGTTTQAGMNFTQTIYVALTKDYALNFTLTSFSDEDKKLLEGMVEGIDFK